MKSRFRIFMVELLLGHLPANWSDYILGIKRFWAKKKKHSHRPMIIFFTEKGKWHGGFCDRMKGIISLFHFCLCENIIFKINYTFPFHLSDFLLPNEYDWTINKNEISFHRREAKLMNLIGGQTLNRLKKTTQKKQIHAFANRDIVPLLNAKYGTNYTWGELFKKLFKPTEKLQHEINKYLNIIGENYICAVFRFQNLLGDFQEYRYKALSEKEQTKLIDKCKKAILNLQKEETEKKILITSDSVKFLSTVSDLDNIFAFPSKVVHIDCISNDENSVYMKSFLDFYLLSDGKKIFCIGTKEMYASEFPLYAAKVNNIPFERILIQ